MDKDKATNKDIVYIDVEDDVTSVIGKVKGATQKIVALVPPKSLGTLQSAVNLRLLQKAADGAGKRVVLITNNPGLKALAAGVKIPVARNLQSKPEIPATAVALPDDDDVIKGDELPVGELAAATAGAEAVEAPIAAAVETAASPAASDVPKPDDDDITIAPETLPDLENEAPLAAAAAAGVTKPKKSRVPNFDRFRKLIFIGGGAVIAIILFFVLGGIFWSGANVVITAQTSDEQISIPVTLTADGTTNPDSGLLKSETKTLKKTASVDFTPTGKKNVGDKATGTVRFSSNDAGVVLGGETIPAGTELQSSGGSLFTTDASVTINVSNYRGTNVTVTAERQGTASNGASGSVSGAPDGVSASLVGSTGGGTDKTVTVVSSDDVAAATAKLAATDPDGAKSELTGQFGSGYVTIDSSFATQAGDPVSNPAVGSEAATAKLTRDTTYTLSAVARDQLKALTTAYLNGKIDGDSQKIYDDGSKTASLGQFITSPSGVMTARVTGTGKVGPNIDEDALKKTLVGKKPAEITGQIKAINGVRDVTVSLNPFWRTTAPAADKIRVSFDLSGN